MLAKCYVTQLKRQRGMKKGKCTMLKVKAVRRRRKKNKNKKKQRNILSREIMNSRMNLLVVAGLKLRGTCTGRLQLARASSFVIANASATYLTPLLHHHQDVATGSATTCTRSQFPALRKNCEKGTSRIYSMHTRLTAAARVVWHAREDGRRNRAHLHA